MVDDDMRYAVVILDGASGEPLYDHRGLTTLEAAVTPHLDALAAAGLVGLARNVPEGLEPSSNVACTSIVGYDPADYPIGRGALELAALGVDLADDEVALRVNLTNVTPGGIMHSYSTDNISNEDGHALGDELIAAFEADGGPFGGVARGDGGTGGCEATGGGTAAAAGTATTAGTVASTVAAGTAAARSALRLYKGTGFRLYLVVTGRPGLMETELVAAHNIADLPVADYPPRGPEARFIKDFEARAKTVLAASPVNARRVAEGKLPATDVFAFWPGRRPDDMEDFTCRYGKRAALNSGVDLLNGIAQLAGIRRYHFDGVTDGPDNDYAAQGAGALEMLADNDVVFIHVEAPDAEGHDGNAEGKRRAVEAIDREIIGRLREYAATRPLRILALPDHPTPVATKRHTREPVPFVMAGPGIAANGGGRLTEGEAKATGLLVDPGYRLLGALLGSPTLS